MRFKGVRILQLHFATLHFDQDERNVKYSKLEVDMQTYGKNNKIRSS